MPWGTPSKSPWFDVEVEGSFEVWVDDTARPLEDLRVELVRD